MITSSSSSRSEPFDCTADGVSRSSEDDDLLEGGTVAVPDFWFMPLAVATAVHEVVFLERIFLVSPDLRSTAGRPDIAYPYGRVERPPVRWRCLGGREVGWRNGKSRLVRNRCVRCRDERGHA